METSDSLIKEILDKGPSPRTIYLILSRMKEEGRLQSVTEECLKALEKYPEDINIRRLLGETYFEDGRFLEAESELKEIIAHIEDSISCYSLQADLLIRQNREDEAIKALKLYLAHRPDDEKALSLLESLQPREEITYEPEPAREEESITVEEPGEETVEVTGDEGLPDIATATLAEIYYDQGRMDEAAEIYEKVIAQNPDDAKSLQRLDEIRGMMEQGQEEDAGIEDRKRRKKEKMIAVLESWLASIKEQSNAGVAVG